MLGSLVLSEGRITSPDPATCAFLERSTGETATLDPGRYDGFVLVGLSLHVRSPERQQWLDDRLSDAVQVAVLRQRFALTTMGHVLGLLRQTTNRPVWLIPTPLPRPPWEEEPPPLPTGVTRYTRALANLKSALETATTHVLGQPADTILHDRWTSSEYGEGARNIQPDGQGAQDRTHMNAAFGQRLWDMLVAEGGLVRG